MNDIIWMAVIVAVLFVAIALKGYSPTRPAFYGMLLSLFVVAYLAGRKKGRDTSEKAAEEIQAKRESEYAKIDSRNTSADDVAERLRNGRY